MRAAETQEQRLREARLQRKCRSTRQAERNILSAEDRCEIPNSRLYIKSSGISDYLVAKIMIEAEQGH